MELSSLRDEVALVANVAAMLGEGPVWLEREEALYWVDIRAPRIWRWCQQSGHSDHWTPPFAVTALAPRAKGGFVAATALGFALIDPERDIYRLIGMPEAEAPGNRFNDGKVDREGRFWAGTMDDAEREATGALYRLDPDLDWHHIDHDYGVTNGPAFSLAGRRMYHSDSERRCIYSFDIDVEGRVGGKTPFLTFGAADGYPDGMTVDAQDCLWVAFWDGWCLRRFSPEGRLLQIVEMPVQRPTSCAFGGPGLQTLFVTSARTGLDQAALERQPLAGALFAVEAPCGGVPQKPFAG